MKDMVLTGTAVYGPLSENSDIDIVLLEKDAIIVWESLDGKGYRTEAQNEYQQITQLGGFYFDIGPLKFNIIVVADQKQLGEWKKDTDDMKKLPPIEDREKRLQTFHFGKLNTNEELI